MADLTRLRPATAIDLEVDPELELPTLARAINVSSDIDSSVLACLAGRWPGGGLLAFGCDRTVATAEEVTGDRWIGWQAYQAGLSWWGRFSVLIRHLEGRWQLSADDGRFAAADLAERVRCAVEAVPALGAASIAELSMTDRAEHLAAVEHAISAIRAGELYQVNICARIHGTLTGSPLDLFALGVAEFDPDYAAFIRSPQRTVVSFSPELFLHRSHSSVRTAPIKGTRRRTSAGDSDAAALELLHSAKDRAENVMIVDLMRNDLSRVSTAGSVEVPALLTVRAAPGVWHLVSDVQARLRPEVGDRELIEAAFPPGSVTGAPKSRAVTLIDELESEPRGLFTGAIGYLSIDDESVLNVAIRTLEFDPDGARFSLGVGGGITAESVPSEEWRECLVKAAPLLDLGGIALPLRPEPVPDVVDPAAGVFETLTASAGRLPGLADHLTRLGLSVAELYGSRLPDDLAARMQHVVRGRPGRTRLRVVAAPVGEGRRQRELAVTVEVSDGAPVSEGVALTTVSGRRGSWRHKWNDRRYLAAIEAAVGDPARALPLFVDAASGTVGLDAGAPGTLVLETSRSNIAVFTSAGDILTPPLDDRVLPGITRRRFLDAAGDRGYLVRLRAVGLADLLDGRLVLSLNSSGITPVISVDGAVVGHDDGLLAEILSWLDSDFS